VAAPQALLNFPQFCRVVSRVVFVRAFEQGLRPRLNRLGKFLGVNVALYVGGGLKAGVIQRLLQHLHTAGRWDYLARN
jgi:hypothetical protein